MHEDVFQGGLAERHRLDLGAESIDQLANQLVAARPLDAQGSIDERALELELREQFAL